MSRLVLGEIPRRSQSAPTPPADVGGDFLPSKDLQFDLGSSDFTWAELYVGDIYDENGNKVIDTRFAAGEMSFGSTVRSSFVPQYIFGAAAGTQLRHRTTANASRWATAGAADTFVDRFVINNVDHGTDAHDIIFYDGDGTTPRLTWDDSATEWLVGNDFKPASDTAFDLGSSDLTWKDLYIDIIYDRDGVAHWDVNNSLTNVQWLFNFGLKSDDDILPETDVTHFIGSAAATWAGGYFDGIYDRAGALIVDVQNQTLDGGDWLVGGSGGGDLDPSVFGSDLGDAINYWGTLTVQQINDEGGTVRWDTNGNLSVADDIAADNVAPNDDVTHAIGSATFTYAGGYFDQIFDRAGASVLDIQNAETDVAWRFNGDPTTFGAAGGEQFRIDEGSDVIDLFVAGSADSFTRRIRLFTADSATAAHDMVFYRSNGTTATLQYDDSRTSWILDTSFIPGSDLIRNLGTTVEAWGDLHLQNLYDESGNLVFDTSAAGQTYTPTNVTTTRSFDADSTTLAEVADVLGTVIEDLQAMKHFA